jgi:cytochrome c oxidase assembly factor CtaG
MGPPRPSFPGVLLDWSFDPLVVAGVLLAAAVYLRGVYQLRRAGRPWSPARTVAFLAGLAVVVVALQSAVETYDQLFSVHVVQHTVLAMVAPPLLTLGAPVTLALLATPTPVRRRITRLVHSPPVKLISHPLWAWLVFTLSLYVLYYSPLFGLSLRNDFVHNLVHLHFLAAGLLFWWPVVAVDPSRWKLHPLARLGFLFLMIPFHAFLGVAIMGSEQLLTPELATYAPAWLDDPVADQQAGGAILWGLGDLIAVVSALGIMVAWANDDEKQARREDRRLDRDRATSGPLRPTRPGGQQTPSTPRSAPPTDGAPETTDGAAETTDGAGEATARASTNDSGGGGSGNVMS